MLNRILSNVFRIAHGVGSWRRQMHPRRTDRDGEEIHLGESGNCCVLEGSMSNCYATIHPNDAKLRGGFLPKHLSLLDHSFRLSTAVCLSHFSVACLVTQASSGHWMVLFFNVFSRMPRFLLHFRLFFLTK